MIDWPFIETDDDISTWYFTWLRIDTDISHCIRLSLMIDTDGLFWYRATIAYERWCRFRAFRVYFHYLFIYLWEMGEPTNGLPPLGPNGLPTSRSPDLNEPWPEWLDSFSTHRSGHMRLHISLNDNITDTDDIWIRHRIPRGGQIDHLIHITRSPKSLRFPESIMSSRPERSPAHRLLPITPPIEACMPLPPLIDEGSIAWFYLRCFFA